MKKIKVYTRPQATCDYCNKDFTIWKLRREIAPDIIEEFFECSHCHAHYTILVTDKETRDKISKRESLHRKYRKAMKARPKTALYLDYLMAEDERLKKEIAEATRALKKRYGL